jgi:hypothetical protein
MVDIDAQELEIQGRWSLGFFLANFFEGVLEVARKSGGGGVIAFLCGSFLKIFIGGT